MVRIAVIGVALILGLAEASVAGHPLWRGAQVYKGTWSSQSTGHTGPMRARLTPRSDGGYDARFSGRFALIIPFTYRVQLMPAGSDGSSQRLTAYKRLGPILGSYQMSADLSPGQLLGGFQAAGDNGVVRMQRLR